MLDFKNLGKKALIFTLAFQHIALVPLSYAGPQGGVVTGGVGSISQEANITNITQISDRLVIDWDSFNLDQSEIVNFLQSGRDAFVLNQILQNSASQIDGQINANGQVLLVNPRGVIFGENAQINAAGLIASSLWISKEDFLNGNFAFEDINDEQGVVINKGLIAASGGGGVTLLGESVENQGMIQADLGYVNLAAGKQAFLTFDESGFLGVTITQEVLENELGLEDAVKNSGDIQAKGGKVALSAKVSSGLFDNAVNNTGMIKATGFGLQRGGINIDGAGADVLNSGALDVSGHVAGQVDIESDATTIHSGTINASSVTTEGGKVAVLGERVALADGGSINADGKIAGGQVLVGGDFQGKNEQVRNAEFTFTGADTSISANATDKGNGGRIIVWADNTTRFHGDLEAKGGTNGGDGGFAEVSGKEGLVLTGGTDLSSTQGENGTLLLDPRNILIVNGPNLSGGSPDVLSGSNPSVEFSENGGANSSLTIDNGDITHRLRSSNVELQAIDDITLDTNVGITLDRDSTNTLTLTAGDDVFLNGFIDLRRSNANSGGSVVIQAGATLPSQFSVNGTAGGAGSGVNGGTSQADDAAFHIVQVNDDIFARNITILADELQVGDGFVVSGTADEITVSGNGLTLLNLEGVDRIVSNQGAFKGVDGGSQGSGESILIGPSGNNEWSFTGNTRDFLLNGPGGAAEFFDFRTIVTGAGEDTFNINTQAGQGINLVHNGNDTINYTGLNQNIELVLDGSGNIFDAPNFDAITSRLSDITGIANSLHTRNTGQVNLVANSNFMSMASVTGDETFVLADLSGQQTSTSTVTASVNNNKLFTDFDILNLGAGLNDTGLLQGGVGQDQFVITADNTVRVGTTEFRNVDTIDGGTDSAGQVVLEANGQVLQLEALSSQNTLFKTAEINVGRISNVDISPGAAPPAGVSNILLGTGDDETFTLLNSLNGGTRALETRGVQFTGIDVVNTGGGTNEVRGSAGADDFRITSDNNVTARSISFSSIAAVNGLGGTDTVEGLNGQVWNITANSVINASAIGFSQIERVTAIDAVVTDTVGADDTFTLLGGRDVSHQTGITFNNVATVNAGAGRDTIAGVISQQWQVDGDNAVTANNISFNAIEAASAPSGVTLTGTSGNDVFTLQTNQSGDGVVGFRNIDFSGVSSVDLETGAPGPGQDILLGSSGADAFLLTADNTIQVRGITFNSLDGVDGAAGRDTVTSAKSGEVWTFADTTLFTGISENVLSGQGVLFKSVEEAKANSVILSGITEADEFSLDTTRPSGVVNDTGLVAYRGVQFGGVVQVNGGSGTDEIVGSTRDDSFILNTISQQVTSRGILFTNIRDVDGGQGVDRVTGNSGQAWDVRGAGELRANNIRFTNLDVANATNVVLSGTADNDVFTLLTNDSGQSIQNAVRFNDIDFEGVSSVLGAANTTTDVGDRVVGTDGGDIFQLSDPNTVTANSIIFSGIESVDGAAGDDTVSNDFTQTWGFNSSGQLTANQVNFTQVENADAFDVTLTGTENSDLFVVRGGTGVTNRVEYNGISFGGVTSVNGAGGNDTANGTELNDLFIVGSTDSVNFNGIGFTAVEAINAGAGDNTLRALDANDTFTLGSGNSLTRTGTTTSFSGLDIVDGGGGSNRVIALANATIDVIGDRAIRAAQIDFSNVDQVSSSNSTVNATNSNDTFTFSGTAPNQVSFNNITFGGLTRLNANAGDGDRIVGTSGNDFFTLEGIPNQVNFRSILFTGIENVDATAGSDTVVGSSGQNWNIVSDNTLSADGVNFSSIEIANATNVILSGTTSSDTFVLTDTANEVRYREIIFAGVSEVNALNETGTSDTLSGSANVSAYTLLNGVENAVLANNITFREIDNVTVTGSDRLLQGSGEGDEFRLSGNSNQITSNSIIFSNLSRVDAQSGEDIVIGGANEAWNVTAANTLIADSIEFSNIEQANASNVTLAGTATANTFVLENTPNTVEYRGVSFGGVVAVNGNANTGEIVGFDSVGVTNRFQLTDQLNQVTADGIVFSGIGTVVGGDTGGDVVESLVSEAWSVTGENALSARGVNFTGIEQARGVDVILTGTAGADTFTLIGLNSRNVRYQNIRFTGVQQVNAGEGADQLNSDQLSANGTNNIFTLNGGGGFSSNNILFSQLETVNALSGDNRIEGSSGQDTFALAGNNSVSVGGTTFNQISRVSGEAGVDTVSGSTGQIWQVNGDNALTANSVVFTNIERADAQGVMLSGSSNNDVFTLETNASGVVNYQNIRFSGVTNVNALGGTDTVTGSSGNDEFTLGNNTEITANGVTYASVERVNGEAGRNIVNGTTGDDEFRLVAVSGANQNNNTFDSNQIRFSNIASVNAGTGTDALIGSSDNDLFVVSTAPVTVSTKGISFSGVDFVDGADGQDRLNGTVPVTLDLNQGASLSVDGFDLNGANIENIDFDGTTVLGSLGNDVFELLDASSGEFLIDSGSIRGLYVPDVIAIDGRTGDDTLNVAINGGLIVDVFNNPFEDFRGVSELGGWEFTDLDTFISSGLSGRTITYDRLNTVSAGNVAISTSIQDDVFRVSGSNNSVSINGINFNQVASINAGDGSDTIITTVSRNWQLAAPNELRVDAVDFSNIEVARTDTASSSLSSTIIGTAGDDLFVENSVSATQDNTSNSFTAQNQGITFRNIRRIDGQAGSDTLEALAGQTWSFLATDVDGRGQFAATRAGALVTFEELEQVTSANAALVGVNNQNDNFDLSDQSGRALVANNVTFSDVVSVNAGAGSNNDTVEGLASWTLQATDNRLVQNGIDFTNINRVVSQSNGVLTGTTDAAGDVFIVPTAGASAEANVVQSKGIRFENIAQVNALAGADRLQESNASVWAFNADGTSLTGNGITYTGLTALDSQDGRLQGRTAGGDVFVTGAAARSLSTNGIAFSGIANVEGRAATDRIEGANNQVWTVSGVANQIAVNGTNFTGIEEATSTGNGELNGRDNQADSFILSQDRTVSVDSIVFSNIAQVDGGAGSSTTDIVSSTNASQVWEFITDAQIRSGLVDFTGIEQVDTVTASVLGVANADDAISVDTLSSGQVDINRVRFNGVQSLDARGHGTGANSGDSLTGNVNQEWRLSGADNALSVNDIAFTNIENVSNSGNGSIVGTSGADQFEIAADSVSNTVTVNRIEFSNVNRVDGAGGEDVINSTVDRVWQLSGVDGQITASDILFSAIEVANSQAGTALRGTTDSDVIAADANNANVFVANAIRFNNINQIDGNDGADRLSVNSGDTLTFTTVGSLDGATLGEFQSTSHGVSVSNLERVVASNVAVIGTANDDRFVLTGTQQDVALRANNVEFSSVATVDARAGTDSITGNDDQTWLLQGTDGSVRADAILFSNVETATNAGAGALNGTAGVDAFVLGNSDNEISVAAIAFEGIASVDGGAGEDTLLGNNGQVWSFVNNGNAFVGNAIQFQNTVEVVTATNASVLGDENTEDVFVTTNLDDGSLIANNFRFIGVSTVDGRGQASQLVGDESQVWQLSGVNNQISTNGIDFANIGRTTAQGNVSITGTSGDDVITLSNQDNSVTANNILFDRVASVNTGEGDDEVVAQSNQQWRFTSDASGVTANQILLTSFERARSNNATVIGADQVDDTLVVTGLDDNVVNVNNIVFSGVAQVDGAGNGSAGDLVVGDDNQVWRLSGESNRLTAVNGIDFANVERTRSNGSSELIGTDGADRFTLSSTEDRAVVGNGITFGNISRVDAGANVGGEDVVEGNQGQLWAFSDVDSFVGNQIVFDAIERATAPASTVEGSQGVDNFVISGDNHQLSVNNIAFDGVTSIIGGTEAAAVPDANGVLPAPSVRDVLSVNSSVDINIENQTDGSDGIGFSDTSGTLLTFRDIEDINLETSSDITSNSGFGNVSLIANNVNITTTEDVQIQSFDVADNFTVVSDMNINFVNNVEFDSNTVNLDAGQILRFGGDVTISRGNVTIAAGELQVEGDIDVDVNAERAVEIDEGQYINFAIFNSLRVFSASESSVFRNRDDEIDNADSLRELLESTEIKI